VQFVLSNKRFELRLLTYKQMDFQVLVISGLPSRRDKTFVILNVNNFVNLDQTCFMVLQQGVLKLRKPNFKKIELRICIL